MANNAFSPLRNSSKKKIKNEKISEISFNKLKIIYNDFKNRKCRSKKNSIIIIFYQIFGVLRFLQPRFSDLLNLIVHIIEAFSK